MFSLRCFWGGWCLRKSGFCSGWRSWMLSLSNLGGDGQNKKYHEMSNVALGFIRHYLSYLPFMMEVITVWASLCSWSGVLWGLSELAISSWKIVGTFFGTMLLQFQEICWVYFMALDSKLQGRYHLVMTNIAMKNPYHKWRFLAGKII
jgi:hypothetical protein